MNELAKQDSMTKALATMEFKPALLEEEIKLTEYNKLPLSRLNSLGVGFKPLVQAIEQFSGNGTGIY